MEEIDLRTGSEVCVLVRVLQRNRTNSQFCYNYTAIHIYVYMCVCVYIYICVCVCVFKCCMCVFILRNQIVQLQRLAGVNTAGQASMLETQGRADAVVQVQRLYDDKIVPYLWEAILFVLFEPSTDQMRLTHIMEDNLFYSKCTNFFFILFYLFIFSYSRFLLLIYYAYQCIYVNPNLPIHPTTMTTSRFPPLGVHTFVLYICVSISALHTGSSVSFFQIPHICINIRYLFFSF